VNPVAALTNLGTPADSRGVAIWGSRLLVADGKNGLRILDVAVPADPILEDTILNVPGAAALDQATAVQLAEVPTRTFALVADGAHGLRAVNITPTEDFRKRLADPATNTRGFRLSMERWDPMTPFDPKNKSRQVFTFPATGNAPVVAVAKGYSFDAMADASGRRMRDNWQIGSTTLDDFIMARMRNVVVLEVPGTKDIRGDGLGCVVRDRDIGQNLTPDAAGRCLPAITGASQ
jgi:hypothetical protein